MDKILGIGLEEMIFDKTGSNSGIPAEEIGEIEQLVQERQAAKKSKDFQRADEIRNLLKDKGIILEDKPTGTTWKKI